MKRVGKFDDNGDFVLLDNIDHEEAEKKYTDFFNTFENTVRESNTRQGANETIKPLSNSSQFGFEGIIPQIVINDKGIDETSTTTTPPPSATDTVREWYNYFENASIGNLMREMPNILEEVLPLVEPVNLNFDKNIDLNFTNKEDVPLPESVNNFVPSNMESVNEKNITEIVEEKPSSPPQEEEVGIEGNELALREGEEQTPPPIEIGLDKIDDAPNGLVLPMPPNIVQGDHFIFF